MNMLERTASKMIRAFQGWNSLRHAPLAVLQNRPAGRGLDVGCARGDLAAALVGRGWSMSGVEPSPSACAAAAQRGIDVRCGTLATVSLEPGSYDMVVFRHSLEHINDPVSALRTVASALSPGGELLITVPNFGSWQARRFLGDWYHLDLPRHRVHFTSTALEHALSAAKLNVTSMSTSSSAVGFPASLQYVAFGRCLLPSGFPLRAASSLCTFGLPVAWTVDGASGGGDLLHAVARRSL
jgi:SAM-dependent methyltransferase